MLNNERKAVEEVYRDLVVIGDEIVAKVSKTIDKIVNDFKHNFETMSNSELSNIMLQLGIEAFYFGQRKDHALLKQACAEAIYKEGLAKSYNITTGTVANRQNQAQLDTNEKLLVKLLYDMTANLMKTKLDETHRLINVISSVIINRNAEAKLNAPSMSTNTDTTQKDISSDTF